MCLTSSQKMSKLIKHWKKFAFAFIDGELRHCSPHAAVCSVPLILLFCRHSPVPTITWRKINGNIPKKARLRKSQAVLEIPNVQLEDSGTYECKAENPRGGTAFKGHLQVYSESEIALVLIHC